MILFYISIGFAALAIGSLAILSAISAPMLALIWNTERRLGLSHEERTIEDWELGRRNGDLTKELLGKGR